MTPYYVLDSHDQPMPCDDLLVWAQWCQTHHDQRHVAWDRVRDAHVSTVFLGLDHNDQLHGPLVLWETMIFGGPHDQYQERYASREEALAGHAYAVMVASRQERTP